MRSASASRKLRLGAGVALVLAGALLCLASSPVAAAPPPVAPAHDGRAAQTGQDLRHERRARRAYAPAAGRAYAPAAGAVPFSRCGLVTGIVGAAAGGALGAQLGGGDGRLATTAAGTLLGYLVGSGIGRSMDYADRDCLGRTLERVPDAQTVAWRNPGADAFYRVTPYESYRSDGRYCREYTLRAAVAGRQQQAFGIACRQPDGSWQIVR